MIGHVRQDSLSVCLKRFEFSGIISSHRDFVPRGLDNLVRINIVKDSISIRHGSLKLPNTEPNMPASSNQTLNADEGLEQVLPVVLREKDLLNDDTPSVDIFDLDYFEARMTQLRRAFPESFFNHSLVLKANSIRGVLETAVKKGLMGAECASISEVIHAIQCGFSPDKVVYGSPVKTKV